MGDQSSFHDKKWGGWLSVMVQNDYVKVQERKQDSTISS